MRKMFVLVMCMLFVFGMAFNVIAEDTPSDFKRQYQAGQISGADFCDGLANIGQNVMKFRQMGYSKRLMVTEIRDAYDGFSEEFILMLIDEAYTYPKFVHHENMAQAMTGLSDYAWEYCENNLLD